MGSFFILLCIFLIIYILFGMELFAHKVKFDDDGNFDLENGTSYVNNFDTFVNSFVTLF
jgi:hypothetical protein